MLPRVPAIPAPAVVFPVPAVVFPAPAVVFPASAVVLGRKKEAVLQQPLFLYFGQGPDPIGAYCPVFLRIFAKNPSFFLMVGTDPPRTLFNEDM